MSATKKARGVRDTIAGSTLLGNLGSVAAHVGPVTIAALAAVLRPLILKSPLAHAVIQATIVGANPSATASDTAVNGTSPMFMRSDGAPKVQKASPSAYGLVKYDGSSITLNGSNQLQASGGLGLEPLVNGNLNSNAAPGIMTDAVGQTIGVPFGSASPGPSAVITSYSGSGLAANRPSNPNVCAGATAVWYSTDTLSMSAWTGSAWHTIF